MRSTTDLHQATSHSLRPLQPRRATFPDLPARSGQVSHQEARTPPNLLCKAWSDALHHVSEPKWLTSGHVDNAFTYPEARTALHTAMQRDLPHAL